MDDQAIEQEIQAKGLTAPRVMPSDLIANIASVHYFTAGDGYAGAAALTVEVGGMIAPPEQLDLLTFCVLVLQNGFTVTGESACASPANFNEEIGRSIAYENAKQKIWPLMGYALKQRLLDASQEPIAPQPPVCNSHVAPGCEQFSAADIVANAHTLLPYQQRVVVEYQELISKRENLAKFFNSFNFKILKDGEKERLRTQIAAMRTYSEILAERIAAF